MFVPRNLPNRIGKPIAYLMFIKDAPLIWEPISPFFDGLLGRLPFEDSWCKAIVCLIVAALRIARVTEAANTGGKVSID